MPLVRSRLVQLESDNESAKKTCKFRTPTPTPTGTPGVPSTPTLTPTNTPTGTAQVTSTPTVTISAPDLESLDSSLIAANSNYGDALTIQEPWPDQ